MKIDHIECQVICDGEVLTEYREKDDSLRAKSCYIISETGKNFVIRTHRSPHSTVAFNLSIDGKLLRRIVLHEATTFDAEGVLVDSSTLRLFQFSPIMLTDDDSASGESERNVKDIGTICMEFYRVDAESIKNTGFFKARPLDIENRPVHERTKKAGCHRVSLGAEMTVSPSRSSHSTYIDVDYPYCTFKWRYRSKDMLQAQEIVPLEVKLSSSKRQRSSIPSGVSCKRSRTGQSSRKQEPDAQVKLEPHPEYIPTARELQARQEAIRVQRAALRAQEVALEAQEAALEEDFRRAAARGIKREASPIALLARGGDVVDLTEDD